MLTISVDIDAAGDFLVSWRSADYQLFVEAKGIFHIYCPPQLARFIPEAKTWIVAAAGRERLSWFLDFMATETGALVEGLDFLAEGPKVSPLEAAYQTLHLLPATPLEVVKASYKALAQLHHPDRGGDTAMMQAINGAFDEIMRVSQKVRAA